MALAALLVPGFRITGILGPFLMVFALSVVNTVLWDPNLFYAFPESFSAHAISLLLANGLVFWVLAKLLPEVEVSGILPAVAAPVVFSLCSMAITQYGKELEWGKLLDKSIQSVHTLRDAFIRGEQQQEPVRPQSSSSDSTTF